MQGWAYRLDCERRLGNITGDQVRALVVLEDLAKMGEQRPSEARIANLAGVSRSTVQRAKRRARELGLLVWQRQWDDADLRREKPCLYDLTMPVMPATRRERQTDALKGRTIKGRGPTRTVAQQIDALPSLTPEIIAMIALRKSRLTGYSVRDGEGPSRLLRSDPHRPLAPVGMTRQRPTPSPSHHRHNP